MAGLAGKKILIRADASPGIGSGHVMRQIVLAEKLRESGAEIIFASRNHGGSNYAVIKERGFTLRLLPPPPMPFVKEDYASWLGEVPALDVEQSFDGANFNACIIDHYGARADWQNAARKFAGKIIVMDDEGLEKFDCDLLVNQNYFPQGAAFYDGKVPQGCKILQGPEYALLRPEFAKARGGVSARKNLEHLLILMGGNDVYGVGQKIIENLDENIRVTWVTGPQYSGALPAGKENVTVLKSSNDVAALMANADFCIGAAGTTSWERCCLKLPSALFVLADNQRAIAQNLHDIGAAYNLGDVGAYDFSEIKSLVSHYQDDQNALKAMSEKAGALVDGLGAARVCEAIEEIMQ